MWCLSRLHATSWSLVQRAAAGNPADREGFAQRYDPVIRAYLSARWKLPYDHDRVQDGTQEVFVQCFKQGGALETAEPGYAGGFRAFLYGVARNVAMMMERSWARRREVSAHSEIRLDEFDRSEATLSQAFDRAWAALLTHEARELMQQRAAASDHLAERLLALELRYQQGLPSREVARRMGIPGERAYQLVRAAKRDFRVALLEVMASYHATAAEEELEQRCADLLALL